MPTKSDTKPKAESKSKAEAKPKAEARSKATAKPKAAKPADGAKVDGLHRPLQPSPELSAIVGDKPLSRSDVVSKLWEYIKANDRQNPADKREILADDKLEKVFGKPKVTMFEMNKLISPHLK